MYFLVLYNFDRKITVKSTEISEFFQNFIDK